MKKYISLIAAFLILFLFNPCIRAQKSDDIKGVWLTGSEKAQVRIFKATNGKYYGKIEWLKNPKEEDGTPKVDSQNPDESKRKEPLIGLLMLKGFKFDTDDKEWEGGTIYDPNNGNTYKCIIWFENGNQDILHVKGYIGFALLGREEEWTREAEIRQ